MVICQIIVVFEAESDETALAVKKAVDQAVASIKDARVSFKLDTRPDRGPGSLGPSGPPVGG